MKDGKRMMAKRTPYEIAAYVQERLALLPDEHKRFEYPHIYKVGVSKALLDMREAMINERLTFKN
jgi:nicotinate phosphoribosyltransferase